VFIKGLKIETISVQKIPPNLPLPKGGISSPSLEKRGEGRFTQCKSYFETVINFKKSGICTIIKNKLIIKNRIHRRIGCY